MNDSHPKTKRIAIIYTGGTIGMEPSDQGLTPSQRYLNQKLQDLATQLPLHHLEVISLDPLIDSSHIRPSHWQSLQAMIEGLIDRVDGIVMLHGTDTMAYTASLLHYALPSIRHTRTPLILTGAQRPWSDPRSDAQTNVIDAIEAASHDTLNGVFIAFNRQLFLGVAARKLNCEGFHGFDSPNHAPIVSFGLATQWPETPIVPTVTAANQYPDLDSGILALWMVPNQQYDFYRSVLADPRIKGLILMAYGSGNTPNDPHLMQALTQVTERGGLVIVLTQCVQGSVNFDQYAAAESLKAYGCIAGHALTPEAAQARLRLAFNTHTGSIRDAWDALN